MTDCEKQKAYEEEEKRIKASVEKIKHRVAVFSGKGGVGKTTVSVNLSYALQFEGYAAGILDADITGPNVAKMMGVNDEIVLLNDQIIPSVKFGLKMMSIASMIKAGQPVVWRGPMRSKVINQFLADVDWSELDYLIADLPPGTGDEIITVAKQMKPDYAVVVTTPQQVAIIDAQRAINLAKQLEIQHIGVIENMSGFVCPHCSAVVNIFGEGGGEKLAEEYGVEFLGSIPIDIDCRIFSDDGKPILIEKPDCEVSKAFKEIAEKVNQSVNKEMMNHSR